MPVSLVSGGAGFIGSNLVRRLREAGDTVHVLDNLSAKRDPLPADPQLVVHVIDIRDAGAVAALLAEIRPERVFHLAAQIDVRTSMTAPDEDAHTNVLGTVNLVSAAAASGAGVFVNASTGGAIYGETPGAPATETTPAAPLSPYGVSKFCAETYTAYFGTTTPMRTVTVRLSNVYGPGQDPRGEAGVIAIFCDQASRGDGITVYGDGDQTRDFVYVEDVVSAFVAAADRGESGAVYNVGTGTETSVNDLVGALAASGYATEVRNEPARPGEVRRSVLDASFAASALDWRPAYDLGRGLALTMAWIVRRDAANA